MVYFPKNNLLQTDRFDMKSGGVGLQKDLAKFTNKQIQ